MEVLIEVAVGVLVVGVGLLVAVVGIALTSDDEHD